MINNPSELLIEIIDSFKQVRQYKDEYLYEDRLKWLRDRFDEDHFDFPDDYDISSSIESIGILLAQTCILVGCDYKTFRKWAKLYGLWCPNQAGKGISKKRTPK